MRDGDEDDQFTAVWPAEVLRFIQGYDAPPPTAPRRTISTYVRLFWVSFRAAR